MCLSRLYYPPPCRHGSPRGDHLHAADVGRRGQGSRKSEREREREGAWERDREIETLIALGRLVGFSRKCFFPWDCEQQLESIWALSLGWGDIWSTQRGHTTLVGHFTLSLVFMCVFLCVSVGLLGSSLRSTSVAAVELSLTTYWTTLLFYPLTVLAMNY